MTNEYDWFSLDRQTLFNLIYSARHQIVNITFKIKKFHDIITKIIKDSLPLRIRKEFLKMNDDAPVTIGGIYDSDLDYRGKKSIILRFVYNKSSKKISLSRSKFSKFCKLFADTVLHEIIHMCQSRQRKFKSIYGYASTSEKSKQRKEQTYLGHNDEIGAYSFNIACELHDKFKGDVDKIICYLNNSTLKYKINDSWSMYLRAFDYQHNHPIIKKLKKRVIYYISRNRVNKPF